ncbi:3-oxoacyl-[acyl-carrier-protein] synthase I, chloroplastic-like [Panicum miliaceum]|uniref:3-oxoacyl-[acyl-carrier-protein] synthase n=1 Tax=Panicum miliaceum TaxID=4540 RepID=A0A3L6TBS1_PANMI|nr:3-oxoacyl-[acyl-carrier-protein] synthase I, chloroplastic-like [Panicum miliaceum]
MQTLLLPDAVAVAAADVTPRTQPQPRCVSVSMARAPRRESDPKKRVVITGMGVVSVFGNDVGAFYDRLLAAESGAGHIDRFDATGFTTRFAAQILGFSSEGHIDSKSDRRLDDCQRYALVAARKALESAGLALGSRAMDKIDLERAGVVVGSGIGGVKEFAGGVESLTKGPSKISPFSVPLTIPNMASALVAIDAGIGFLGPNYSVSTACATSNHCLHSAADQIRLGRADIMLADGAEAAIAPVVLGGFAALGALSRRNADPGTASRPWDRDRDGFVIGEGAGVMESLEHAMRRGAPVLAEYLGGAASCDAHHVARPRPDGRGVSLCIKRSLEDAGVAPEEVNYVNANATSSPAGDLAELKALKQVFKDTSQIKMNATKNPDPAVEQFDTVRDAKQRHQVHVGISNSFGFGGQNSVVVFAPFRR